MLLKDYKVKIPENRVRIQKKDNYYYVYLKDEYIYKQDKKYSIEKRVCIGRKIDDEYMIPNERYSLYFDDLQFKLSEPGEFSDTLKIGSIVLFDKILKDIELEEILNVHEEKKDTLVNIASYMLIEGSSALQYYPGFAYDHNIRGRIFSDSFLSRYLDSFKDEEIENFLNAWNALYGSGSGIYINCDGTNMNSSAQGIQLLEYGHSKKEVDLKQVNISFASLAEDATPLFYEVYPGSIIDNSELALLALKAGRYGYEHIGFILDRGYCSKKNIGFLDDSGYSFIMMVRDSNTFLKAFKQEISTLVSGDDLDLFIDQYNLFGKTFKAKLYPDDKKERCIHVYYDEEKAAEERSMIRSNIARIKAVLDAALESEDIRLRHRSKCERFSKLVNLHYEGEYLKSYSLKKSVINRMLKDCGYFALISSKKYDAAEILSIYRSRDSIEKLYMALKTHLDLDTLRVHTDSKLKAKLHIGFIASIIRNEIYKKSKELKIEYKDRKNYTVPAMIKELEKIECSKTVNNIYELRYALTARQKKILKLFDIDEKYLRSEVKKINKNMEEIFSEK
nr:transposase [Clostridia bacterium]